MSRLASSASSLISGLRSSAGVAVTYRRSSYSVALTAIPGSTDFETVGPSGVIETIQTRDWIVKASELILNSAIVLPAAGDEIDETVGSEVLTYRVVAPTGDTVYRFSDPYRKILRIHSKLIGAA